MRKWSAFAIGKLDKQRAITLSVIACWVILINGIAIALNMPVKWPISMSGIFYFALGGTPDKAPHVFLGGCLGIGFACLLVFLTQLGAPYIGRYVSTMIPLAIMIFSIIVFGPVIPFLFNRATFAFMTISCINTSILHANALLYIAVFLIGGGITVGGYILWLHLLKRHFEKKAALAEQGDSSPSST
ncbi:hypothetical protein LJB83_01355 [Clostridia bacterium OttesenSCG-928-F22]|nr:hypothetical protein [Clostridia bacterium OttesenSCG-928-F22]